MFVLLMQQKLSCNGVVTFRPQHYMLCSELVLYLPPEVPKTAKEAGALKMIFSHDFFI